MLVVRYSAFFDENVHNRKYYNELTLSLITLERFVCNFINVEVIIYTLSQYQKSIEKLISYFSLRFRIIVLDIDLPEKYAENREFANSLSNMSDVDRLCVMRMLTDFYILDNNAYRLLIGTDIFFLDCPQELLSFVWGGGANRDAKVLYMRDMYTFAGKEYKIRYFHPPILNGLLGDFYCLAPGVSLEQEAIKGCLKMIETWPVIPSRFDPPLPENVTTPEQHAAAILLYPFGGEALPSDRYSHISNLHSLSVLHTHTISHAIQHLDNSFNEKFIQIYENSKK